MLSLMSSVALLFTTITLLLRIDKTRISRLKTALVSATIALSIVNFAHWRGELAVFNFTNVSNHLSNFYGSVGETAGLFEDRPYFGISTRLPHPDIVRSQNCTLTENTPNIILIHEESLFPPSTFKEIKYNKNLDQFFRSGDGQLHKLRVETYGSGSWLTEFSVLAGLSTDSFGGVRSMAPKIMTNKLRESLPQWFKHCGFTNIELNPLPEGFAFAGNFHRSIGFDLILDKSRQGAKTFNERDEFYFNNAISAIRDHFKKTSKPIFTYIITMASHYPYNYTFAPEEKISGGSAPGVPEMNEFLRRLGLAAKDYQNFILSLKKNFPNKKFVIIHYGDHQPIITQRLIDDLEVEAKNPSESIGYLTYFVVDGINYEPPNLPDIDVIDVPYLESLVIYSAQIPRSEATQKRLDLLKACGGRYANCPQRQLVKEFQNFLFASGILKIR